jgi:hypothetical protein
MCLLNSFLKKPEYKILKKKRQNAELAYSWKAGTISKKEKKDYSRNLSGARAVYM